MADQNFCHQIADLKESCQTKRVKNNIWPTHSGSVARLLKLIYENSVYSNNGIKLNGLCSKAINNNLF